MTGWFEFNGVKCTDLGIYVSELPKIGLAEERVKFTDVPGRNGSLAVTEGDDVYEDITLSCTCWVRDMDSFTEIGRYLHGSGWVRFGNRQEGRYRARITNQIDFEQILRGRPHRKFTVNFRCKPFCYLDDSADIAVSASGRILTNKGNVFSEPSITVYPIRNYADEEDDLSMLTIGRNTVELYDLTEPIIIDTEMQEAYYGNKAMNHIMSGDFPVIPDGKSIVSWTGNIDHIVITPRWRKR